MELQKDSPDISIVNLFTLRINEKMTYLKEKAIEEAVVNHYLLNFFNLEELQKSTLDRAIGYLVVTCDSSIADLGNETSMYTKIISNYKEMIKTDINLKKEIIQTRNNTLETIAFFDQVCTFKNKSEIPAKYFDYEDESYFKSYFHNKQMILDQLEKLNDL